VLSGGLAAPEFCGLVLAGTSAPPAPQPATNDRHRQHTRFLGVPYDWRRPTWARVRARWWNATDDRVFTPKTFGWGFAINLHAVLRRLRLNR